MLTLSPVETFQSRATRKNRRLVLVDIENFLGGAMMTAEDVMEARNLIGYQVGSTADDQVIVGVSHMGMFSVHHGWRKSRLLIQSGPDGADLMLLNELQYDDISLRFQEVVLISGDGIFTDAVANLTARNVRVTVVAPSDGCSRRLEVAASVTIKFDRIMSTGVAA